MAASAKLADNGRIVIPAAVREAHGWQEGMELEFVDTGSGVVVRPLRVDDPRFPPVTWDEFVAKIPKVAGPSPTAQEIDAIVLEEAARRFDEKTRR